MTEKRHQSKPDKRIALIDMGSNSVRLVVYDIYGDHYLPRYNKKKMCRLGAGLARTGALCPDGVARASKAMAEFIPLTQELGVDALHVFATAAMRDAEDGQAFANRLTEQYGISIELISGEQEALFAANGVIAAASNTALPAHGMIADLGGGSLELARINHDNITFPTSLPMGVLRLMDEQPEIKQQRKTLRAALKQLPWIHQKHQTLHVIGGSFRNIHHIHMQRYQRKANPRQEGVRPKDLLPLLKELQAASQQQLSALPLLSKKRMFTLPTAALILRELIKASGAESIDFSPAGVREGYLYDRYGLTAM